MNIEKLVEANALAVEINLLQKFIEKLDNIIDPKIIDTNKGLAVVSKGSATTMPLDEAAMVRIAKQARGNLVKHLRRAIKKLKVI